MVAAYCYHLFYWWCQLYLCHAVAPILWRQLGLLFNCLQVMWLTICTGIVGYVPEGKFKRWLNYHVSIMCFGVLSSALSAVITYHNPENRPKCGICVANHTSPIDVLVLACDNCYALVGCGVENVSCVLQISPL